MTHELLRCQSPMGQDSRHIRPGKGIGEKGYDDNEHRFADSPPRRFKDEQNANGADDEIRRRDCPRTQYQMLVFIDNIGRRRRTGNRKMTSMT